MLLASLSPKYSLPQDALGEGAGSTLHDLPVKGDRIETAEGEGQAAVSVFRVIGTLLPNQC